MNATAISFRSAKAAAAAALPLRQHTRTKSTFAAAVAQGGPGSELAGTAAAPATETALSRQRCCFAVSAIAATARAPMSKRTFATHQQQQPRRRPGRRKRPTTTKNSHSKTFGMRPINYSSATIGASSPPPHALIYPSPLAPPPRPGVRAALVRSLWPLTLVATASLGLFIYLNSEDEHADFWKTMETGGAILPDNDDDDDDDDEEDYLELLEEEEEAL